MLIVDIDDQIQHAILHPRAPMLRIWTKILNNSRFHEGLSFNPLFPKLNQFIHNHTRGNQSAHDIKEFCNVNMDA